LPALWILGQLIAKMDPSDFAARARMIARRQHVWVIKAARGYVDFVRKVIVLEGQLGAAPRAEGTRRFRR
jgi:hypothetical protein